MALMAQPTPWTAFPNREIGDSAGNIVQYTQANVGLICLAANAHDRLSTALAAVDVWLSTPVSERMSESELAGVVKDAIGKIGAESLAVSIEALAGPSPTLDRAISVEFQLPETAYTSSIDAALTLVPSGWSYSVSTQSENRQVHENGAVEPHAFTVIEMKAPDGRIVKSTNASMPIALCAAAVLARGAV